MLHYSRYSAGLCNISLMMKIIAWNVHGLGGHLCKKLKACFRQKLQNSLTGDMVDLLFLHHLIDSRIVESGMPLRGNWEVFWSPSFGLRAFKAALPVW